MPEIPLSLVQRRVSRGGQYQPAGAVQYPRLAAPVGGLAESISRAGAQVSGALVTMHEVQRRERDAADTITVQDFTARVTDELLDWQQNFAVDQSIPPMELRNRLEAKRDELHTTYAEQLPARIRPKFLAQARQAAVQPLYTLDQVGVQRLGEQATATFEHRSEQIVRQRLQSASAVEQRALDEQYDQLVNDYAFQGLTAPAQVPVLKQKYRDKVAVTQMEAAIRLDPKAATTQLEQGPEANPTLPPDAYIKLLDSARSQHQQQLQWYDQAQRRSDQAVSKAQAANAADLWAEMVRLDPTPDNSEKLRNLLAQADQLRKDEKIDPERYEQLSGRGRVLLDRSLQPGAEKDNVALERELIVDLARASNDEAIKAVQDRLLNRASELRPETIQRLNTAIDGRLRADHYSATKEYRDGVDIILRAGVIPDAGGFGGGALKEGTQRKLALALEAYDQKMSEIGKTDINQMKAQARDLAYRLRDLYLPLDRDTLGIPPAIKDAANEAALKEALRRMEEEGVPFKQRDTYRKWWQGQEELRQKEELEKAQKPPSGRKRPGAK